jgi:hypothetical protein
MKSVDWDKGLGIGWGEIWKYYITYTSVGL